MLSSSEKGRVDINVRIENIRDKLAELEFYVKDTGIGIPEDKFDMIFEKFTQEDSSTTRKFGGTGLGITIAKKFIEKMGGKIWVKSSPGEGSTFYFTIKIKTSEIKQDEKAAEKESSYKAISWKKPLKILIAEDSEDNLMLIKMYLGKTPHILDFAHNGKIALEKFISGDYDLVLMDMEMPIMDGYKATKEIRKWEIKEKKESTPILALTAHALKEHEKKGIDAGCTAHVSKPIKKQKLLEVIYRYAVKS